MDFMEAFKAFLTDVITPIVEQSVLSIKPMNVELSQPKYISVSEACRQYCISVTTVYRMFDKGDLDKIKIGDKTLVSIAQLDKLYERHMVGSVGKKKTKKWRPAV